MSYNDNLSWPQRISEPDLYVWVEKNHHTHDDFIDGDIAQRLEQFEYYDLAEININTLDSDEFDWDEDVAQEYAELPTDIPPIIYDPVINSIIDGTHRLNAAIMRGDEKVLAYIGDKSTYRKIEEHINNSMRKYIEIINESEIVNENDIDPLMAQQILDHKYCHYGLKVGHSYSFWRGESEYSGSGMASWGLGKYITTNKKLAKKYAGKNGMLHQLNRHDVPYDLIRFDSSWEFDIWFQDTMKILGVDDKRTMNKRFDSLDKLFRSLDASIKGIQIGKGNDVIICIYGENNITEDFIDKPLYNKGDPKNIKFSIFISQKKEYDFERILNAFKISHKLSFQKDSDKNSRIKLSRYTITSLEGSPAKIRMASAKSGIKYKETPIKIISNLRSE